MKIEMGIGWVRDEENPKGLRSANPGEYATEIQRLRNELEVSESCNRTKTLIIMDVKALLSDADVALADRATNALTTIEVRTGPPRTTKPTVNLREYVSKLGL